MSAFVCHAPSSLAMRAEFVVISLDSGGVTSSATSIAAQTPLFS